jgi:hypothetical protein
MARPNLFDTRASINVYLEAGQKDALTRAARQSGISPSALIRQLLQKELAS